MNLDAGETVHHRSLYGLKALSAAASLALLLLPAAVFAEPGYTSYLPSQLSKGLKLELDGEPYVISDFVVEPPERRGRSGTLGPAKYRTTYTSMITGSSISRTYRDGEAILAIPLSKATWRYAMFDGELHRFRDGLKEEVLLADCRPLRNAQKFLQEHLEVVVWLANGRPVHVEVPDFIEAMVLRTDAAVPGHDTKNGVLVGGAEIAVPLDVNEGDKVKVDTRGGGSFVSVVERIKK